MGSTVRRRDLDDVAYVQAFEASGGVLEAAAKVIGVSRNSVKSRLQRMEREGRYAFRERQEFLIKQARKLMEFEAPELPPESLTTGDLVVQRKNQFRRRKEYEEAARMVRIKVRVDGPIGILHFGDPHLDDDGTDIEAVEQHCEIVRDTPGLMAACVGDVTNNWVGRLARLYAEQSTTAAQAWQLAEWFMEQLRGHLLYLIGGNHDAWSGPGDPLKWIARQTSALYKASECRLELLLPNGQKPRINARHDFAGGSQYNPAHGPMKAVLFGVRDHIAIAGHKHESAYGVLKDPETGITMHGIKVATYKTFDRYQRDRGFRDQTLSPCAVTVFNTELDDAHPDYIKLFWQPEEGAEYLTFLRNRHANTRHSAGAAAADVRARARKA